MSAVILEFRRPHVHVMPDPFLVGIFLPMVFGALFVGISLAALDMMAEGSRR